MKRSLRIDFEFNLAALEPRDKFLRPAQYVFGKIGNVEFAFKFSAERFFYGNLRGLLLKSNQTADAPNRHDIGKLIAAPKRNATHC